MLCKFTNFPPKSAVPGVNSMSQPLKAIKEYNLRLTSFQNFSANPLLLARSFEILCWPHLQGVGLENSGHSLPFPCSLEFSREQQYRVLKIYIQQYDNPHLQIPIYSIKASAYFTPQRTRIRSINHNLQPSNPKSSMLLH